MQYPIIDLITDAYINNGWTGLELTEGKNLFILENFVIETPSMYIRDNGIFISTASYEELYNRYEFISDGNYIISFKCRTDIITDSRASFKIYFRDDDVSLNEYIISLYSSGYIQTVSFIIPNGTTNFSFGGWGWSGRVFLNEIQIEKGTEPTPYEPYSEPKNDFTNRLKLPLPHYFPHPVIDALQRAAAGTQTADDTEILRHYLTPLGIGGI